MRLKFSFLFFEKVILKNTFLIRETNEMRLLRNSNKKFDRKVFPPIIIISKTQFLDILNN